MTPETLRPPHLLIVPGSCRHGSFNLALARAAEAIAQRQGASVRVFDLRALALPLYDGDIEGASGVPASVSGFVDAIAAADAVLFVTPEYNGFPTPLVLNAMDWLSRTRDTAARAAGLKVTNGRPAGLLSASPGPLGGLRSMNFLRQYLQMAFAMVVSPRQYALSRADEAFDEHGALKDAKAQEAVAGVVAALLKLALALRPPPGAD